MGRPVKVVLGVLLVAGIVLLVATRERGRGTGESAGRPVGGAVVAESGSGLPEVKVMPVAAQAARLNSADSDAHEDVMILELLLSHYRRAYEQNPVGLNHEIVRALAGGNAKRAAFLAPGHPAVNGEGELVDRWGTPFFFHQLSGTEMEVISAGPDREMWTGDDVKSG